MQSRLEGEEEAGHGQTGQWGTVALAPAEDVRGGDRVQALAGPFKTTQGLKI